MDINNFSRAVPRSFGAANWVTLLRATAAAALLLGGVISLAAHLPPGTGARNAIVAIAAAALGLDGLDGFLARRLGQTSAFGARFDMETDAVMMLAMSVLTWSAGQAGAWVLLSGFARYIFIVGGWFWPALAAPLLPTKRRQAACVMQMAALILALVPAIGPRSGAAICLAGLGILGYSFGADVMWLAWRASSERRVEG